MKIDVEQLSPAERLLWGYGVTKPSHIDLDAIANEKGAQVIYRPLDGCEARLLVREEQAIISVNSKSKDGRQRFSLAHELAHFICDRKVGFFLCAKEDIGPQNMKAKSVEASANSYASQLVLPTYLVDPWLQDRKATLDLASSLGNEFNASLTAAAIKLIKRTAAPACVTCHTQSKMMWHQRSASFPSEFYVVSELHQDTDAFKIVFGGISGMSRPKREPANRWMSGRDTYRLEVTAQSIKLPDSTVLSLLVLEK
jgi:Zn-dependent peptidase ImmA (M78 family)